MPRRDLKDSNRRSGSLQLLSDAAERLWYRLITAVDDFGRMEAHPEVVFSTCFQRPPKGWTAQKVAACLQELSTLAPPDDEPLIQMYQVGRKEYLMIRSAHIHIYRRAKVSKWPEPPSLDLPTDAHTSQHMPTSTPVPHQAPTPVSKPQQEPTVSFSRFWAIYPRKDGKADAQSAWTKLAPTKDLFAIIEAAITSAKTSDQWTREKGQFIPMPATYLRKRRWEDEGIVQRAMAAPKLPSRPIIYPKGEDPSPEAKAALARIMPGFMSDTQEAPNDLPRLQN